MKLLPMRGLGGGSIIRSFILHCKRLFLRFELVSTRSQVTTSSLAKAPLLKREVFVGSYMVHVHLDQYKDQMAQMLDKN